MSLESKEEVVDFMNIIMRDFPETGPAELILLMKGEPWMRVGFLISKSISKAFHEQIRDESHVADLRGMISDYEEMFPDKVDCLKQLKSQMECAGY